MSHKKISWNIKTTEQIFDGSWQALTFPFPSLLSLPAVLPACHSKVAGGLGDTIIDGTMIVIAQRTHTGQSVEPTTNKLMAHCDGKLTFTTSDMEFNTISTEEDNNIHIQRGVSFLPGSDNWAGRSHSSSPCRTFSGPTRERGALSQQQRWWATIPQRRRQTSLASGRVSTGRWQSDRPQVLLLHRTWNLAQSSRTGRRKFLMPLYYLETTQTPWSERAYLMCILPHTAISITHNRLLFCFGMKLVSFSLDLSLFISGVSFLYLVL